MRKRVKKPPIPEATSAMPAPWTGREPLAPPRPHRFQLGGAVGLFVLWLLLLCWLALPSLGN